MMGGMLAETLGKLLIAQQTLEVLPAGSSMAAFLGSTIEGIPGVAAARVCIHGSLQPPLPAARAACAGCGLSCGEATDGYGQSCPVAGGLGLLALQIRTPTRLMGVAMLEIRDDDEFDSYHPYLENMLSTAAVLLENRAIVSELKQAHEAVLKSRDELERKVSDRTMELAAKNVALQNHMDEREREAAVRDAILNAIPAGIVLLDGTGTILATNRQWLRLTAEAGVPSADAGVGGRYSHVCPSAAGDDARAEDDGAGLRAVLRGEAPLYECIYRCSTLPHPRWFKMLAVSFREGEAAGAVVMHLDITASKESEERLYYLANYDALTGLPNRYMVRTRLQELVDEAAKSQGNVVVLMLDIGRFKLINETLGHTVGDLLLKVVGERLSGHARGGDAVGRMGGDRFAVLLAGTRANRDVGAVAGKILDSLQQPYHLDEGEFFVTTNAGISLYPQDGEDAETLLKRADAAMYRAKGDGRNQLCFYSTEFDIAATGQMELGNDLRHALERGELFLHYHPQVELEKGRITGVEALLRWQHPTKGLIPPAEFIRLAEETGLIDAIGEWALRQACAQGKAWQEAGLRPVRMAVNISSWQFRQQSLVDMVAEVLRQSRLEPKYLELEITESMIMRDIEQTIATLRDLKALGVELSVDDFGTGYSSLSYLKRFPIDTVKIDQSFVREVTTSPDDAAIVKAIVAMAHSLHLRVIAEGVETEGQLDFLAAHHCHEVQGYYVSRPLPPEECARLLRDDRRLDVGMTRAGLGQRTLLLVDDETNITASLKRLLRGDGYEILTADSGKAGLELLATHDVGVILSDQRMPEMTGVEFLRRAKELYPDTVRIVLSGYTDLKSVTDAINEGAIYKFLTKPWEDELLRDNVREAFQRHELKQENARLGREIERANRELSEANHELERRVADKTREIRHGINVLQVSQEVLEHLPAAVIGIDDDGLIVMANRQADALFDGDGPLLGCGAHERLPVAIAGCMEGRMAAPMWSRWPTADVCASSAIAWVRCASRRAPCWCSPPSGIRSGITTTPESGAWA